MTGSAARIEDYALLSDRRTATLVSRAGSVDWLCAPRLDSASVFAALLGTTDSGCWTLAPTDESATSTRYYDGGTFVLVTRWVTATGVAEVHEWMDMPSNAAEWRTDLVRRVVGVQGTVEFSQRVMFRFDYARALPWVRQVGAAGHPALWAVAGPDAVLLRGAALHAEGRSHVGRLSVAAGESVDMVLTWFASYFPLPGPLDVAESRERTVRVWTDWASRITHEGPYRAEVLRSLLVLQALTNRDTGGIAAAATTSLPEFIGGERNWDYRYVWLRDAALTLEALLIHGFIDDADRWRAWLLRAVAGDPADAQIMYGLAGERNLPEWHLDLAGYEGSRPVRVGNDAALQYQADVIGEVMVTLGSARRAGLAETQPAWALQRALLRHAESQLDRPDNGLWEVRGEPRLFTHSRVMMWAAFDRGVNGVEQFGMTGPVERWRAARDRLQREIDASAAVRGYFTQHPDTDEVDAALLLLPQVGYCTPDDPRMLATVEKIEKTLMHEGFLRRYRTVSGVDGLQGQEHPFLACSFWLVEQYACTGREQEARQLMDRLCALANDVGLLSEEYDPVARRQMGNVPQAYSHLALVRAADALALAAARVR